MIGGLLRLYHNNLAKLAENQRDKLTSLLNRKTFDDQIIKINEYHSVPARPARPAPPSGKRPNGRISSGWADRHRQLQEDKRHLRTSVRDEVLILVANLMCVLSARRLSVSLRRRGVPCHHRASGEDDAVAPSSASGSPSNHMCFPGSAR
jgi:hypothetical protein